MTIEQIIERRREDMAALSDSEDVKRYRLLEYQLDRLVEVRDILREETEVAKVTKPKPAKPARTRAGSLAGQVDMHLRIGHAFGMTLEELSHHTGFKTGKIKRAIDSYLGTVFSFDMVSGLYSLKSREAERISPIASPVGLTGQNGGWDNPPPMIPQEGLA